MDSLDGLPDGPLPRAAFTARNMTLDSAAELRGLEWRTKIEPKIPPDATRYSPRPRGPGRPDRA